MDLCTWTIYTAFFCALGNGGIDCIARWSRVPFTTLFEMEWQE